MIPIAALFQSRKFLIVLLVSLIGAVFVWRGLLSTRDFASWVGAASLFLVGAIAHEDAAGKSAGSAAPGATTVNVSVPPKAGDA